MISAECQHSVPMQEITCPICSKAESMGGGWMCTCAFHATCIKGNSTNCTHEVQFTSHEEYYTASENGCLMSSVAQEELCK